MKVFEILLKITKGIQTKKNLLHHHDLNLKVRLRFSLMFPIIEWIFYFIEEKISFFLVVDV